MDDQLVDDIFDLIYLVQIDKITSFKNNLDLNSLINEQTINLLNELHNLMILICDLKFKELKFKNETLNIDKTNYEIKNKRIKLSIDVDAYLVTCEVLNDYFFELMNIGKWFNVSVKLRFAFGLITLYFVLIKLFDHFNQNKQLETDLIMSLLNKIDYGLIYSPLFLNKLLAKIATKLHDYLIIKMPIDKDYDLIDQVSNQKVKFNNQLNLNESKAIKRVKCIDLNEFYENYFIKKIPVIIENAIDDWRSVQNWNLNYILQKAAYRLVPIEIGSKYTDMNWTQKIITIKEFVDQFIIKDNNSSGYCAQYELFEKIEQLSTDFYIPDYCALSNLIDDEQIQNDLNNDDNPHINAWFGPKNTISPLHTDPKDNLFAQVFGSKYVRLYSPTIPIDKLYIYDSNLLNNTSQVDVENIDPVKFPNFPNDYQETILNKGDLLFIPEKHWHYVRSLETSFSISFWWT